MAVRRSYQPVRCSARAHSQRPAAARVGVPGGRPSPRLTPGQVEAVTAVMRLFVEDDLANGVPPARTLPCVACGREQPAPGFVRYDGRDLCNACATAYELRRLEGPVRTVEEYLTHCHPRPGA